MSVKVGAWTAVGMVVGGAVAVALAVPTGGASVVAFGGIAAAGAGGAAAAGGVVAFAAAAGGAGIAGGVAASVAGGVTGVAIGGVSGYVLGKKKEEKAYEKGQEDATAKQVARIQKLEKVYKQMQDSLENAQDHYQVVIALDAVGIAAIHAIGKDSAEDQNSIEELVAGVSKANMPDKVKKIFEKYKKNPPSIHEAIMEVKKVKAVAPEQFKEMIQLAFSFDEAGESPAAKKFIEDWNREFA